MTTTGEPVALSVAEIQLALRDLRARHTTRFAPDPAESETVKSGTAGARVGLDEWGAGWVGVAAAHAGAGASTVALSITDALSAAGIGSRLVELADRVHSGFLAAAEDELGVDPPGCWRRGRRGLALIYRRAHHRCEAWPTEDNPGATVVDLGLPTSTTVEQLAGERPRLVVVCRATVPGVRAAARLLDSLNYPSGAPVVVASVGPRHWPGPVTASGGRPIARLKTAGRVVAVPIDARLQVGGLTAAPLPRAVMAAGRAITDRISPDLSGGDHRAAAVPPASGEGSR